MALFKILKGQYDNLPDTYKEGWMYITDDYGDIYLDTSSNSRIQLNANKANYIRYISGENEYLLSYDDLYHTIRTTQDAAGYFGMLTPGKKDNEYIRTSAPGLLPHAAGSLEQGSSSIGKSDWRFENAYLNNIYSRELNIGDIATIAIDNSSGENILAFCDAPVDFSDKIYTQQGIEDQGGITSSVGLIVENNEDNSASVIVDNKITTSNDTRLISLDLEEGVVIQSPDGNKQLSLNEEGHFSIYESEKGLATLDLEINSSKVYLKNGYADGAKQLVDENLNGISTSQIQLPYFDNGVLKENIASVGSQESFIYLKDGEFVKTEANVGDAGKPVFMENGYLYECDDVLNIDISGKATYDSEGNHIASTYVTLSTDQEISGNKTFSGQIILTEEINYGENLPTSAVNGQIFFKPKEEDAEDGNMSYDYLPITGGVVDGNITAETFIGSLAGTAENSDKIYINSTTENDKYYIVGSKTTGNAQLYRAYNANGSNNNTGVYFNGATGVLFGAAWNDYAEYRRTEENIQAGNVVIETGRGDLILSTERLQPGAEIVSDTFGFAIGETENCKTPIAVSGRVLAYPAEDRNTYAPGDAVCSGPCGTVSKMTREEIKEYPDRIIGTVSEIPNYNTWGYNNVAVRERIWIRIK